MTDQLREWRMDCLIAHLPVRVQRSVRWLRRPSSRWARIPAGGALMVGGCLAILPVFGLWMFPLGLVLLAEDVPALYRVTDRWLDWLERKRPGWFVRKKFL